MPSNSMRQKTNVIPPVRRHVVISVDDDPLVLSALRRVLDQEKFDLRMTLSPDQAVRMVGEEDVSLVISDQRMPVTSGIDMLRQIRRRSPRTSCAMLTAYPSDELNRDAEQLGVRVVLTKPWDDAQLRQTIRLLLREHELAEGPPPSGSK